MINCVPVPDYITLSGKTADKQLTILTVIWTGAMGAMILKSLLHHFRSAWGRALKITVCAVHGAGCYSTARIRKPHFWEHLSFDYHYLIRTGCVSAQTVASKYGHTKPTSKSCWATEAACDIRSRWLCLGQRGALEHTAKTTANGQLVCTMCT